jgi:hypothetical protein
VIVAKRVVGHQPLKSKCPHAPFNRRADELCTLARKGYRPPNRNPPGRTKRNARSPSLGNWKAEHEAS